MPPYFVGLQGNNSKNAFYEGVGIRCQMRSFL